MNILWASHFLLYPDMGHGALQRSKGLLKELSRYNDIYLVSFSSENQILGGGKSDLKAIKADLEKYCKKVFFINSPDSRKKSALVKSVFSTRPYSTLIYTHREYRKKCREVITKYNIDLIHSDTLGLVEPDLDDMNVVKSVTHHNIESSMLFRRMENETNFFKKMFLKYEASKFRGFEKKYCKEFDINICVSALDADRLKEITGNNVRMSVIENGVDTDYYQFHKRKGDAKKLVFAGSLDWYPNAMAMEIFCDDFWPYLKKHIPELELTIIGKNPTEKLERAAQKNPDIKLLGFVDDLRKTVSECSIYICPFNDGGGTRLKVLDAMSQGIPIIGSTLAFEGINVEYGKSVLLANSKQEYLEQLNTFFASQELKDSLSANARQLVEKEYSMNVIGKKLHELYTQQISDKKNQVKDFFDDDAADYEKFKYLDEETTKSFMLLRQEEIANVIQNKLKSSINEKTMCLDAGCGPGFLYNELRPYHLKYTGMDISTNMLKLTKKKRDEECSQYLLQTDIERIALKSDSYHILISLGVIEYLKNDIKALAEFHRLLKKDGYFVTAVTNRYSYNLLFDSVIEFFKNNRFLFKFGDKVKRSLGLGAFKKRDFTIRKHSPFAFDDDLKNAGFKILHRQYFGFNLFPYPFNVVSHKGNRLAAKMYKKAGFLKILGEGYLVLCQKK